MRTALIVSADNVFNRRVMPAFLASIGDVVGIVAIHDRPSHLWQRLRREWRRSRWRIADVLAFRIFYKLRLSRDDRRWISARAASELARLPTLEATPVIETDDPNTPEVRAFLESTSPDLTVAACKTLLRREIFDVATHGTFVVHPGICPEYRNAHGCFWALARRDLGRVGATLLRIDEGIDTGPVFAHYRTAVDERSESHIVIQLRAVYDNLDEIGRDLRKIVEGRAEPLDVSDRRSAAWGQPRLTDYIRWKRAARRTARP